MSNRIAASPLGRGNTGAMTRTLQSALMVAALSGAIAACGDEDSPASDTGADVGDTATDVADSADTPEDAGASADASADADVEGGTSLSAEVMPIIDASCGGCHTRTDAPFDPAVVNGVFYDDKEDLLALVGSFIVAGDSANSGFVAILTQDFPVGAGPTVMPPPDLGEAMAEEDIAVVVAWIDEGANDN